VKTPSRPDIVVQHIPLDSPIRIATGTISLTLHGHPPSPNLVVIPVRCCGEDAGTVPAIAGPPAAR
jgi:hypothetical protein